MGRETYRRVRGLHTAINRPDGLDIMDTDGRRHHGVNQDWYDNFWRRKAGCGPCTAANMLRYFRGRLTLPMPADTPQEALALMNWAWGYVTPTLMGLNSTQLFQQGMDAILAQLGSPMRCRVLDVPDSPDDRPLEQQVAAFLRAGLQADSPVAFLNLHNAGLPELDNWHWITVTGLAEGPDGLRITAADNGNLITLDLSRWLKEAKRGGGFVTCA